MTLNPQSDGFGFKPGYVLAGKYKVLARLGSGIEGEVYQIEEELTKLTRAVKLFYPTNEVKPRAVVRYAKMLEQMRDCPSVIRYHAIEKIRWRRQLVYMLVSEYTSGQLLSDLIQEARGKRLPVYEALRILYDVTQAVVEIHKRRLYHGDLHSGNILIQRRGVHFDIKIVDFYDRGPSTLSERQEDVVDLVRLLYEMLGERKHYQKLPPQIRAIILGPRRDRILAKFPTVTKLRDHLDRFAW
ncbi:MAG: serine/threonine protein kinase [Alphaproteobacteria bacterium]|nr:MAG: serine/threonine protein kinase [Alphaproteobacteria bacterium]